MLPIAIGNKSGTVSKQMIKNAQNIINQKAMMVQRMMQLHQQQQLKQSGQNELQTKNLDGSTRSSEQSIIKQIEQQKNLSFSELFSHHLFHQNKEQHQIQDITDSKLNIQQIINEINQKGSNNLKENYFLESFLNLNNNELSLKKKETVIYDKKVMLTRVNKDADNGSESEEEKLMDWQQDSSDPEFDKQGVQRRGESQSVSSSDDDGNDENSSDEDGGEMMPAI